MDNEKLKRKLSKLQREAHESTSHQQSLMISMEHFEKWKTWKEAVDFVVDELKKFIKKDNA